MKNELREIIESKIKILSEKTKDGSLNILAPWIVTGRKNKNGRLYPYDLIQREIARVQAKIKAGALISSADHPAVHTSLADASHIIRKLEIDKDGKGWMEATILPTTKGKNVMTIIKAGGQLGISARGAGNVSPDGTVENDYQLLGIDFCTNPSEPEAVFNKSNVCESLEFEEDEDDTIADREEALYELLHTSFDKAVADDCWYGDFESYKALHEKSLRAMLLLPEKDGRTSVQKLTEEQGKSRTWGFFDEAKKAGFKGNFEDWKQAFPQLAEQASKPIKLSEERPKPKEPFVGDARFYYNEAVKAGYKDTIEKFKEQHPEFVAPDYEEKLAEEIKRKKPIKETLEQEAQRIFEGLKKDNPNSTVTLSSVERMLEAEEIVKSDKRLRKRAVARVSRDLTGSGSAPSQAQLEKMVETELASLKEEETEKKKKELTAYRRLLDE